MWQGEIAVKCSDFLVISAAVKIKLCVIFSQFLMQKKRWATTYDDYDNHSSKYCDFIPIIQQVSVRNYLLTYEVIFDNLLISHIDAFPCVVSPTHIRSYFSNMILQQTLNYHHHWHFYVFYGDKKIYFLSLLSIFFILCC